MADTPDLIARLESAPEGSRELSDAVLLARFLSKVDCDGPNGCWIWRAGLYDHRTGYGAFWFRGRMERAHRASWELHHGPIPAGTFICHRCDNPICVNPAHLFCGDHSANMADMYAKGRGRLDGLREGRGHRRLWDRCPNGHPLSGDNLYLKPNGERQCKICKAERQRRNRSERRSAILRARG